MKKSARAVFGLVILLMAGLLLFGTAYAGEYAPGQVLVLLKSDVEKVDAAQLKSAAGMSYVSSVAKSAGADSVKTWGALSQVRGEIFTLMTSETRSTEELLSALKSDPRVVAASPNYKVRAFVEPNDPYYADKTLWGLLRIRANEAWDTTTGSETVHVAVADTGVYASHEDLAGNVDMSLSRNFSNGNNPEPRQDTNFGDGDGHGTHVSGTIGAIGNNGKGVTGVNWNVKILALKVLDDNGEGYLSWSMAALDYLVELLNTRPDIRIPAVNFSLGGWAGFTPSEVQQDPYWAAYKALDSLNRTVIVVAAGNEGLQVGAPAPVADSRHNLYNKGDYVYPASLPGLDNMIVVGALNKQDQAPDFSNWSATSVQLAAPGTEIVSTASLTADYDGNGRADQALYVELQGTSMAAPHVSGTVALLSAQYPNLNASLLKQALLDGANGGINPSVSSPYAYGQKLSSNGLLDVKGALDRAASMVPATEIGITPAGPFEMKSGETMQLSAIVHPENANNLKVVWSSSNSAAAKVDASGLVTAVRGGDATITAQAMGGVGVTATASVTVYGSSAHDYVALSRSARVQEELDNVNKEMVSGGVRVDFGSLNNAMANWTPGQGQALVSSVRNAALTKKNTPSGTPSGYVATGKPASVFDVDVGSIYGDGTVALVPITVACTLSRTELVALFGATEAGAIIADPAAEIDTIFGTLALYKEISGRAPVALIPGAMTPRDAVSAGILTLESPEGGNSLAITLSFLVADKAGSPAVDRGQLIVPDGTADGRAYDPLWLMKKGSAPSPDPDPTPSGGGGSGCDSGAGVAAMFLLPAILTAFRSRRRV